MQILCGPSITGEGEKVNLLNLVDVKFMDLWQPTGSNYRTIAYHTLTGSYLSFRKLTEAAQAYKRFGFNTYGRSVVVNDNLVKKTVTHENGSNIYFLDGTFVRVSKKL